MHVAPAAVGLRAIAELMQALADQGIRYCHWKSNLRLAVSLDGRTDLDLLVDRRDALRFRALLLEHDVKPVLAPPGKRYPGLEDYLGFDAESGRMFHLHVHYQLVLGEQFVKNYRLPLEERFLASARLRDGVMVPAPELELIVLTLRALLKYRDRDVVKDVLTIRSPGIPEPILEEVHYLLAQTTTEQVERMLDAVAGAVPADVVQEALRLLTESPRAGYRLFDLRRRTRQALRPLQRTSRLRASITYLRELWSRRNTFLRFAPARGMTSAQGGLSFALVGADGAGKSTLSALLAEWLGWKLDVHAHYLGSKQPSRRSRALYIVFRMARRSQRHAGQWFGERSLPAKALASLRDALLGVYHISIGWDRKARYQAGTKQALSGSIVLYDRFPLEAISSDAGFRMLDGPQISSNGNGSGLIMSGLAAAEERLYRRMRPPDILFVLDVNPEVALQRKPDHERSAVEAKSRAIGELAAMSSDALSEFRLVHVDAGQPLDAVLRRLKAQIWKAL
ncbi:MAG: hypothetical protein QM346_07780 [Chloroflexota bacterium]|nr:hypothetical protein [Chloroflexota bacterium]